MHPRSEEIDIALRVFVQGYCVGKSLTHPYEWAPVESSGFLWVMRDAPRKNVRDYRKEEWIAHRVEPRDVDAAAHAGTRGRYFVCALQPAGQPDRALRDAYKALGYRLLSTEQLFTHDLRKIPRARSPAKIVQVRSTELAARFAKATRTRPILPEHLAKDAPFRQYVAIDDNARDQRIVGWVRSVYVSDSTWCSNLAVIPSHRRRGIATALLAKMLRDDRTQGMTMSVLLSSHAGALLYPQVGYRSLGTLLILAPKRGQ
jgi:ribosomal protein S18 acetylase RimI-like enzyme